MATGKRIGPDDLTHYAQLQADPKSFHLFQALRVIEAQHAGGRGRHLCQRRRSADRASYLPSKAGPLREEISLGLQLITFGQPTPVDPAQAREALETLARTALERM